MASFFIPGHRLSFNVWGFFLLVKGFSYCGSKGATIKNPLYLFRFLTVQPCCKVDVRHLQLWGTCEVIPWILGRVCLIQHTLSELQWPQYFNPLLVNVYFLTWSVVMVRFSGRLGIALEVAVTTCFTWNKLKTKQTKRKLLARLLFLPISGQELCRRSVKK